MWLIEACHVAAHYTAHALALHCYIQSESSCWSTLDTGSRLTCVAVASPESLLRELKRSTGELFSFEGAEEEMKEPGKESAEPPKGRFSKRSPEKERQTEVNSKETMDSGDKPSRSRMTQSKRGQKMIKRLNDSRVNVGKGKTLDLASGYKGKQRKLSKRRLAYRKSLLIRKKHAGQ